MGTESVIEGQCPTCSSPLERREDCGWCPECNVGHSLRGDTYTMHLELDTEKYDDAFRPLGSEKLRPGDEILLTVTE